MKTREDYRELGYWRGKGIADTMVTDDNGDFYDEEGNIVDYNTAVELCFEAEENDRQYSPFEFTAHDINASINSAVFWEAFDEGISNGITETLTAKISIV